MTRAPRIALVGGAVLALLFAGSFLVGFAFQDLALNHCPLGEDLVYPDRTVCQLAVGGLWVSLLIGVCAGGLATALGLMVAGAARAAGGVIERWTMRVCDAFFSLPDVLVLMVLQLGAQTVVDLHPGWRIPSVPLLIGSLALVSWAAPARMFRDRLASLEREEYVAAARALGGGAGHLLRAHLWPGLRAFALSVFLARIPAAILAESTVSFLGIAHTEPMSLGRYLGTSYVALIYGGGARVVGPSWALLVVVVLCASWTSKALEPAERG